jgi:hypothetical protein
MRGQLVTSQKCRLLPGEPLVAKLPPRRLWRVLVCEFHPAVVGVAGRAVHGRDAAAGQREADVQDLPERIAVVGRCPDGSRQA